MPTLASSTDVLLVSRRGAAHTQLAVCKTLETMRGGAAESYHTAREQSTPSIRRSHRHGSDAGAKTRATPHDKKLNSKLLQAARPVRRAATTAKRDLFPVRV